MVELGHFFKIRGKKHLPWFLWKWLKRYLANSSVHGVTYLVEDGRHWTERIFWLICCGLSWWGCIVMVSGVFADFSHHPVATTVETNYLNWKTELPAIHVCYTFSYRSPLYAQKTWPNGLATKLLNLQSLGYQPNLKGPVDGAAFQKLAETVLISCEETFEFCEWNDVRLNCCQIFHPLRSMQGYCHSFNSIFTKPPKDSPFADDSYFVLDPMSRGVFTVLLRNHQNLKASMIYILDKHGLPTITTGLESKVNSQWKSATIKLEVAQVPTYNEDGVRATPIEKRNCRYTDEIENVYYNYEYYTYDACLAEVILRNMVNRCGCVSHLFPVKDITNVCDQNGLACLASAVSSVVATANATCPADCEETTYTLFQRVQRNSGPRRIDLHLLPGPTLRYRRYIAHSKLDLVVAVGGAIGLFVGASILSIVEVPYWLIIRAFDDDDDDDGEEVDRARRQDDRRNSVTSRASYSPRDDRHFAR